MGDFDKVVESALDEANNAGVCVLCAVSERVTREKMTVLLFSYKRSVKRCRLKGFESGEGVGD